MSGVTRLTCPHCGRQSGTAKPIREGARVRCPGCGNAFAYTQPESNPLLQHVEEPPRPTAQAATALPTAAAETKTPVLRKPLAHGRRFHWSVTVATALVAILIGYFLGREHIKYELRAAFAEAGKAFTEGVQKSFGRVSQRDKVDTAPSVAQSTETASKSGNESTIRPQLPDIVEFGQPFAAAEFQISLVEARIDRPEVKDLFGETKLGNDPNLIVVFRVINIDERKILRYRNKNMFLAGHFQLRDDVGNIIRGVSYGAGSRPVGALSGSEDILPGEEASHLELFLVPPPKTNYLILTMDLAAFGGEGETRFKIPAESIANFSP